MLSMHVFDASTGEHVMRIPYTSCSWSDSLNREGGMDVTVDYTAEAIASGLGSVLAEWRHVIALVDDHDGVRDVIHAGPLTDHDWQADSRRLSLTVGGGLTLLTRRLVLNRRLRDAWRDMPVLVDETHPAGDMALRCTGSWRDIAIRLILETLAWAPLAITVPQILNEGDHTRTYYAWDLATVADRLTELTTLEDGLEIRFDPYVDEQGRLFFGLIAAHDLASDPLRLDATLPDVRCRLLGVSADGSTLTTQVWLTGGKDGDKTLMCRRTVDSGLLLQSADTSHTTVERMATLQQHALGMLATHAWCDEAVKLEIGNEHMVRPGDTLDVRVADDWLGERRLHLKITDVAGSSDTDWLTVTAQSLESIGQETAT